MSQKTARGSYFEFLDPALEGILRSGRRAKPVGLVLQVRTVVAIGAHWNVARVVDGARHWRAVCSPQST